MKVLLLGALLICPALAFAGFSDKCKAVNDHRITAGVKALAGGALGIYAAYQGYLNFYGNDVQTQNNSNRNTNFVTELFGLYGEPNKARAQVVLAAGSKTAISGVAAYVLLRDAIKNAKRAIGA